MPKLNKEEQKTPENQNKETTATDVETQNLNEERAKIADLERRCNRPNRPQNQTEVDWRLNLVRMGWTLNR